MPTPNSGFLTTLPANVLIDTGVLYLTTSTPVGVTVGGIAFDPGITRENIDFDGKYVDIETFDRITGYASKLTGSLIEVNAANITMFEPGSASVTSGSSPDVVTTLTPATAGELFASGAYLSNVRVAYQCGDGSFAIVKFPLGLMESWKVSSGNGKKAQVDFVIAARQSVSAGNKGAPPYQILLAPTISDGA